MDRAEEILKKTFAENESVLKPIFEMSFEQYAKPLETSEQYRKSGNDLFTSKKHDHSTHYFTFFSYCKSIATAPMKSENLALAYANKSAFLLHLEKYEDCIRDIDKTLTFAKSRTLKIKLLCRKVECMKNLGLEWQSVIDDAKRYLNKIDEDEKKSYSKLIKKAEALEVSENKDKAEPPEREIGKLPEETTAVGGFAIQYNETDGRHLVATKDYEPGDAIFVESLFVTSVSSLMNYTTCEYCLKTCWSSVPCENCSWAMFCSDDCKTNAWEEFHSVECSLVPYLKAVNDSWRPYHLSIRTLIVGLKTAGSIAELRDELKTDTDISFKGYFQDGIFKSISIENIFLLNCGEVPDNELESMSLLSLMTLIGLVKHTPLLKDISLTNIDDLINHEDLVLLASILLKLILIKHSNTCMVAQMPFVHSSFDPAKKSCGHPEAPSEGSYFKGYCFAPLTCLVKPSCVPNAAHCFTEDKKVIVYALRPIESNTQIFLKTYAEFDKVPLKDRKKLLEKFKSTCDCQACNENWPPILQLSKKYLKKYNYAISTDVEKEVYNDCKSIMDAVKNNESAVFTEKNMKKLSEAIKRAVNEKYPSYLTSLLIEALNKIYSNLYGLKIEAMENCKRKEEKAESSKSAARKST